MLRLNKKPSRTSMRSEEAASHLYVREACGVMLSTAVVFFALALMSYNPHDNTFFNFESDLYFVRNWCGYFGAHCADFLIHFFGSAAYFLLFCLAMPAYLLILGATRVKYALTLLLLPLTITAAASLMALYHIDFTHSVPGGIIGQAMSALCLRSIGFYGSVVIFWSTLWTSLVLSLQISVARGVIALSHAAGLSGLAFFFYV